MEAEMEMVATEPAEAQVQGTEIDNESGAGVQPQPEDKGGKDTKESRIQELTKKGEEDPDYKYTNEELDLLEEVDFGESKKKERPIDTADEDPESDDESTSDEDPEPSKKEDKKEPEISEEIKKALEEVGAKEPGELLDKIKGLKSALGGKDAQAVAKLSKEMEQLKSLQQNEINLWNDYKKGVPAAVNIMRQRGIVSQDSTNPNQNQESQSNNKNQMFIDKDKFIDPESAEMVNGVIGALKKEIDDLKSDFGTVKSERERYINEASSQKARNSVIDEMVKVSQNFDELKDVPNLRDALNTYMEKGDSQSNVKLSVFDELFDIAEKSNTSLEDAFWIKKGRDSQLEIQKAKQAGIKEAYKPRPNKSLSDVQSGDEGSRVIIKPLTEEEISAMEQPGGHRLMPETWFDKEGEAIKSRVPKNAWRLFW